MAGIQSQYYPISIRLGCMVSNYPMDTTFIPKVDFSNSQDTQNHKDVVVIQKKHSITVDYQASVNNANNCFVLCIH